MINDFVEKNRGPLIAMGSAAAGLVVLIIISAIVNMPSDINVGQILVNLIWVIFIGLLLVAGFLYVKDHYSFDDAEYDQTEDVYIENEVSIYDSIPTEPKVYLPQTPPPPTGAMVDDSNEKKR